MIDSLSVVDEVLGWHIAVALRDEPRMAKQHALTAVRKLEGWLSQVDAYERAIARRSAP